MIPIDLLRVSSTFEEYQIRERYKISQNYIRFLKYIFKHNHIESESPRGALIRENGINDSCIRYNCLLFACRTMVTEWKNPCHNRRIGAIQAKAIQSREAKVNSQEKSEKKKKRTTLLHERSVKFVLFRAYKTFFVGQILNVKGTDKMPKSGAAEQDAQGEAGRDARRSRSFAKPMSISSFKASDEGDRNKV